MYYYAFTLSKVRGEKDYDSYEAYLSKLNLYFPIKQYELEKGLHVHCMIQSKTRITKARTQLYAHGWSIRLELLKTPADIGGWVIYCQKGGLDNIELSLKLPEILPDQTEPIGHSESAPPHAPESAEFPTEVHVPTPKKYLYPRFDIRDACVQAIHEVAEKL